MGICSLSRCNFFSKDDEESPIAVLERNIKIILSNVRGDTPYWSRYKSIFSLKPQMKKDIAVLKTKANSERDSEGDSLNQSTISLVDPNSSAMRISSSAKQKLRFGSKTDDYSSLKPISKHSEEQSVHTLLKALDLPSSHETHKSQVEKLRLVLFEELSRDNHVVQTFLTDFHKKFDKDFNKDLKILQRVVEPSEEIIRGYRAICLLIKTFVEVISKIVVLMHQDHIKEFESIIEGEFIEPRWIAEAAVYEIIFLRSDSTLNRLMFNLLKKIHGNDIENLDESFKNPMSDFANALNNQQWPSQAGFEDCSSLSLHSQNDKTIETDQFDLELSRAGFGINFNTMIDLEKRIFNYLTNYYLNDGKLIQNISSRACVDADILVVRRVVVEIQKLSPIIDDEYIDEYVHKRYLDCIHIFRVFQGFYSEVAVFQTRAIS